jgi:hypothetical protein
MHINQQNILVDILKEKGFSLQEANNSMLGFDKTDGNQLEIPLVGNETAFRIKTTTAGVSKVRSVGGFDSLTEYLKRIK